MGGRPDSATVWLINSMAMTGEGHGTEIAIAAGLLGLSPTDTDTVDALGLAEQVELDLTFHKLPNVDDAHPNTIFVSLRRGGFSLNAKIVSVGGGNVDLEFGIPLPVHTEMSSTEAEAKA